MFHILALVVNVEIPMPPWVPYALLVIACVIGWALLAAVINGLVDYCDPGRNYHPSDGVTGWLWPLSLIIVVVAVLVYVLIYVPYTFVYDMCRGERKQQHNDYNL